MISKRKVRRIMRSDAFRSHVELFVGFTLLLVGFGAIIVLGSSLGGYYGA